jgi:hypothetical protein
MTETPDLTGTASADATPVSPSAVTPIPAGTDASAWKGHLSAPWSIELSPGRVFWCRTPNFLEMMAAGTVPESLEKYILYDSFDGSATKMNRNGETVRKSDAELATEMAERWANKLRIAARAITWPKLKLTGTPDYENGEIAVSDVLPGEINEVAFIATRRSLPALPAIFSEPASGGVDGIESGGEPSPGDDVPHETEPVDRADGE